MRKRTRAQRGVAVAMGTAPRRHFIEKNPSANNFYNSACVYALLNRPVEVLDALSKAFDNGYLYTTWLDVDPDFDSIRQLDDFKALVDTHRAIMQQQCHHDHNPNGV